MNNPAGQQTTVQTKQFIAKKIISKPI